MPGTRARRSQRRWLTTTATVIALAALGVMASPALAETYTVNTYADDGSGCNQPPTPGSPCTLRGALADAHDFPGSTVLVPAGTYTLLAGALSIPDQTTLQGEGARTTIIDANGSHTHDRALQQLNPTFSATVSHLTVTGGQPDSSAPGGENGGDVLSMSTMTLDHVHVTDGAAAVGGGVANSGGALTIEHSLLDMNRAVTGAGKGGAVSTSGAGATLTIRSSTLTQNGGTDSGALDAAAATTLTHLTLAANRAQGARPGGITAGTGVPVHVRGSIISGNLSNTGSDLSGSGTPSNCSGPLSDDGANVESALDCGLSDSSSRQSANAAITGLSDQGGETDVLALGADSAAIDLVPNAGCPATDQRDTTRPQGPACDAGAFEAPPPPPPPPPPHEHTLLGSIQYLSATAIGAPEFVLNPFAVTTFPSPADRLEVVLYDSTGAIVDSQQITNPGTGPSDVATYRLDGLPACQNCTVAVRNGPGIVTEARFVSFDGNPGQTIVALTQRDQPGGWGQGRIELPNLDRVEHPLPGTPTSVSVLDLSVRVLDGPRVVADTAAIRPQCRRVHTPGVQCYSGPSVSYILTGLPADNRSLTFQLLQKPPSGPAVVVDTATAPFHPNTDGFSDLPVLTALDIVPASVRGRTLFGSVSYLPPFAPGERNGAQQSLRYAPAHRTWTVALVKRHQTLATGPVTTPATGESGYRLANLPACAACTIQLRQGPGVVDRASVSLPTSGAASVTRRDLQLKDGTGHFLTGDIVRGGMNPDNIRIVVQDPASGKTITESSRLPRACRPLPPAQRAEHCDTSSVIQYRLDQIPADTTVRVVAMVREHTQWVPVDSRTVQTAPDNQDTLAPGLLIPPGFAGQPAGRQLIGSIVAGGSFSAGAAPAPFRIGATYLLKLTDADGTVVGSTSVTVTKANVAGPGLAWVPLPYKMSNLPPCANCTLELFSAPDMTLQNRTPVSLVDEDTSVTLVRDLATEQFTQGPYVTGEITTYLVKRSAPLNALEIRILAPDGHVIISSRDPGIPRPLCGTVGNPCPRSYTRGFALGKAPPSGAVTVVVRDFRAGRVLARQRVNLAGSGADTNIGALELALER